MPAKPSNVDEYLEFGCGRCIFGGTSKCKVRPWEQGLRALREIILESGLAETVKWGAPCYTHDGKNILMLGALKNCISVSFFRGSEIQDRANILELPGENTRFARCVRITELSAIGPLKDILLRYIAEAIEVEKSGRVVGDPKQDMLEYPEELAQAFAVNSKYEEAFVALTPGRQRGYLIYFASAKQSKTKVARVKKCMLKVLSGKGWNES